MFHTITQPVTQIVLNANESFSGIVVHDGKEDRSIKIELNGEGAEARVYGIFVGTDDEVCNLNITIEHRAPHTTSEILVAGALSGHAKADVNGNIHIYPGAKKSNAREEIRTLLLSEDAAIKALPELAIENDDVQCSHAVTTSYIDDEKKFYLESRGMNEKEAEAAVVAGHFALILERLQIPDVRSKIERMITEKLKSPLLGKEGPTTSRASRAGVVDQSGRDAPPNLGGGSYSV